MSVPKRDYTEYLQREAFIDIEHFAAGTTRGLVEAQKVLDDYARERLIAWEQDGLSPSAWTWAECRLHFPVVFGLASKARLTEHTRLSLTPCKKGTVGSVSLTIRYLPTPLGEEIR